MHSNRPGGLPSGPRSRSAVRPSLEDSSSSRSARSGASSSSSSIRTQRSLASIPRDPSRSRTQPNSDRPSLKRPMGRSYAPAVERADASRSSNESSNSSGSSFLDRMNAGSRYTTPRTSFEEDDRGEYKSVRDTDSRGRSLRNRRLAPSEKSPSEHTSSPLSDPAASSGDGYTLWSRVAAAASELTVNVSKAWASNVATFAGEETPPGQESRLTRAMKAYHIEKARSPSDLPAWLFSAEERRSQAPSRSKQSRREDEDGYVVVKGYGEDEPAKPRGLRDVYDAAAAAAVAASARPPPRGHATENGRPSKASDRLKALREAKRSELSRNVVNIRGDTEDVGGISHHERRTRVGLPSGPVSSRNRRV